MLTHRFRPVALLLLAGLLGSPARAADPTDNPVATFYSGPEGYPAWTDAVNWAHVINMKTYAKGKDDFEKFEKARDELSEGGGVLYYPAGEYHFSCEKRGLMLCHDVFIRGEAPAGHPLASEGKLDLPTKFIFAPRERGPHKEKVPNDWSLIGVEVEKGKGLKDINHLGIAWVDLVGATIAFGPQVDWGKTWATANSLISDKVKKGPDARQPDGTNPIDVLAGGGKNYKGAGKGRLVFGCVFEDAAFLDDFSDPGYGPNGFSTSPYVARIAVYGSRVLVANNFLPASKKSFNYPQKTKEKENATVRFDYGKTCGIDVNKELLTWARADGACPGFFEEGVVVRDNYVFNHGHTGYNIAGGWVTITGNHNERRFLGKNDDGAALTLDGWAPGKDSDNRSRAFDLAGRNLWIDGNKFNNTGSASGGDGEGIVGRAKEGTPIYSWAITRNIHERGVGSAGGMGGLDADCHGLLIAWNKTPGWVGDSVAPKDSITMTECAFVGNGPAPILPDDKTITRLGLRAPLKTSGGVVAAPTKVTAEAYEGDAVKIAWMDASEGAIGFRVERRIAGGKWQVVAYRPPHPQGDKDNPPEWVDFTAPPGKELIYRVIALDAEDGDKAASEPTEAVTL